MSYSFSTSDCLTSIDSLRAICSLNHHSRLFIKLLWSSHGHQLHACDPARQYSWWSDSYCMVYWSWQLLVCSSWQLLFCWSKPIHCKNFTVVLTNKDGYLSCTFVHWTLATEQRCIHAQRMHKMSSKRCDGLSGRVSESISLLSMTKEWPPIMDCLPIPSQISVITLNYFYNTKLLT